MKPSIFNNKEFINLLIVLAIAAILIGILQDPQSL